MMSSNIPDGWTENENHDLVNKDGRVIPAAKRSRAETYSRIVGYLRPVAQWNKGKKAEWLDRKNFATPNESVIAAKSVETVSEHALLPRFSVIVTPKAKAIPLKEKELVRSA
jgi:hypothetical protein